MRVPPNLLGNVKLARICEELVKVLTLRSTRGEQENESHFFHTTNLRRTQLAQFI
jgi:hypothetical protein